MRSTILLLLCVKTEPFILPSTTKRSIPLSNKRSLLQPLLSSSTSDNDEEDNKSSSSAASSSFDEAGRKILDEENRELAASIGTDEDDEEFEQRSQEYEAIRQAIRARTADLGIEKSVVSAKLIEDAKKAKLEEIEQARKQAGGVSSSSSPELDLSQITVGSLQNVASSSKDDEDFQIVFTDDLEKQFDELSEEEKNEIDPWWDKGWVEQSKYELTKIEFPDALTTLKESLLVLASVAFMTWVVVNFDEYLRVKFTEYGFIPKPEDIRRSFEGLELPPGWTDGMTDEDLANMK